MQQSPDFKHTLRTEFKQRYGYDAPETPGELSALMVAVSARRGYSYNKWECLDIIETLADLGGDIRAVDADGNTIPLLMFQWNDSTSISNVRSHFSHCDWMHKNNRGECAAEHFYQQEKKAGNSELATQKLFDMPWNVDVTQLRDFALVAQYWNDLNGPPKGIKPETAAQTAYVFRRLQNSADFIVQTLKEKDAWTPSGLLDYCNTEGKKNTICRHMLFGGAGDEIMNMLATANEAEARECLAHMPFGWQRHFADRPEYAALHPILNESAYAALSQPLRRIHRSEDLLTAKGEPNLTLMSWAVQGYLLHLLHPSHWCSVKDMAKAVVAVPEPYLNSVKTQIVREAALERPDDCPLVHYLQGRRMAQGGVEK